MRIEIGIIDNHCREPNQPSRNSPVLGIAGTPTSICRCEVDSHSSSSSRQEEDEILRIRRIEHIDVLLTLSLLDVAIESEEFVPFAMEEVLNYLVSLEPPRLTMTVRTYS